MSLGIVDVCIILLILLGGVIGFKEGAIKRTASIVGLVLVLVVSFILKNQISVFFYENLPFFDFWGIFKGVQVLNILFYELLSFVIISSILGVIYKFLLIMTGLIEKILKATIILSIPSKILGFIIGLVENYIWVYIILFVLTLPMINIREIYDSKYAMNILNKTPILSNFTNKTMDIYNGIYKIVDERESKTNEELNEESLDLMLKYDFITVSSARKLIDSNKIYVNNKDFINKYE